MGVEVGAQIHLQNLPVFHSLIGPALFLLELAFSFVLSSVVLWVVVSGG